MANSGFSRSQKAGLPPGTLVYVGEPRSSAPTVRVTRFNEQTLQVEDVTDLTSESIGPKDGSITWVDVDGIHSVELVEKIGQVFGLHPLLMEDLLNTSKRPKCEHYDEHLFILLKSAHPAAHKRKIVTEQVSIILARDVVISFQEENSYDIFAPVRERLRAGKGRLRKFGADYLAYALLDSIVDSYFGGLELVGETLGRLEHEAISHPNEKTLREMYRIKRLTMNLRRAVWPLREMMSGLLRDESRFLSPQTLIFIRDVYDHVVELIDILEADRDMAAGLMEIYLSGLSNRMNSVMMMLAMVSTIFMPLSFIAGVYGMNFKYMPELEAQLGYPLVLLTMFGVAMGMLFVFRRKGWL
ncbi:MAG: magnesium/cobalt transporter CorA [Oligoflexia bacterium]|nr:magnesium/cobalt transporter CorA [Oligoflexia bacterium]